MTSSSDGHAGTGGEWTLELRPRDPILVRDARPFSADPGARAVTLDWPLPSTIAGALRTHVGNALGHDWDRDGPELVRNIEVRGPFLIQRDGQGAPHAYFPAPRDAVPYRTDADEPALLRLRPVAPGALTAGAGSDLWPDLWPVRVEREVKPSTGAAFWSESDTTAWLGDARSTAPPHRPHDRLPTDVRTHVAIDPETRTQVEGALFSTEALAFDPRGVGTTGAPAEAMLCRLSGAPVGWRPSLSFLPIGGERRQVEIVPVTGDDPWPRPPADLIDRLTGAQHVRLQLVTPGLFARAWPDAAEDALPPPGWMPEWIDQLTLRGKPPHWPGPEWTLRGAVVGRRLPLSGWDMTYRDAKGRRGRPKRTRYAVPAGSVYFFELPRPLSAVDARSLWLRPVADRAYDCRNGFGLVLPGIWEAWEKQKKEGP